MVLNLAHRNKKNQVVEITVVAKHQLLQLSLLKFHMDKLMQPDVQSKRLPKPLKIELKQEKHREKLKLVLLESMLNLIRRRRKMAKERT